MYREDIAFVTAADIRQIIERIGEWSRADWEPEDEDGYFYDPSKRDRYQDSKAWLAKTAAFVVTSASVLDDPSLLPPVLGMLDCVINEGNFESNEHYDLAYFLGKWLRRMEVPLYLIKALARLDDYHYVEVACSLLDASEVEERKLLRRLAVHGNQLVRAKAHELLVAEDPGQWWRGLFRHDPVGRIPEEDAAEAGEALSALRPFVEEPRKNYVDKKIDVFIGALEKLPDELCVEAADIALEGLFGYFSREAAAQLVALLCRREGPEAALRILKRAHRMDFPLSGTEILKAGVKLLDAEDRLPICRALAKYAAESDASLQLSYSNSADTAGEIACRTWPENAPVIELLEAIDGLAAGSSNCVASEFLRVCDRVELSREGWEFLASRFLEERNDAWKELRGSLRNYLAKAPKDISDPLFRRCLASGDDKDAQWALEQILIGDSKDAVDSADSNSTESAKEGAVLEVLRDERTRALFFASSTLRARFLPLVRSLLITDDPGWKTAAQLMSTIASEHGGVIPGVHTLFMKAYLDNKEFHQRLKKYEKKANEKESEPATTEEWAAYRRQREKAHRDEEFWQYALELLPEGEWTESDQRLVDEAYAALQAGGPKHLGTMLTAAYCSRKDPELLARIEEVIEVMSKGEGSRAVGTLKRVLEGYRKELGITGNEEETKVVKAEMEWMDQPD